MSASILLPIVTASLLGSLHCAAMCGGFVAAYAGGDASRGGRRALSHAAYHAGRLLSYLTLGTIAGALGGALDVAATAAGAGRIAAVVAGSVMVLWALAALLEAGGVTRRASSPPGRVQRAVVRGLSKLAAKPPLGRAALFGMASALLPCGWLYAFAVAAAGTGSASSGALVMAAFWSGTLPLLLGLGVGVQALAPRLRRHVPVLSAAALLVLGLSAVLGRWNLPALAAQASRDAPECCHGAP
jgi:sulfite exporter TauE/SafE